jgi:hypothetical protein
MDNEIKKKIIAEYLLGKGSTTISRELKIHKPGVLKVIKEAGLTRKRDRCKSLNIEKKGDKYFVDRICPSCKQKIITYSKDKVIACRNHFRKVNENIICKSCSLKLQIGEGNPFYGKKHNKNTLKKLSDIMIESLKTIPRKQNIVSKKEKKLLAEAKKLKYKIKGSYNVANYICDIFIEKLNLIIEFNGDYWHCNPSIYSNDYYHKHKKKYAQEIWKEDEVRIDNIKKLGYNLEVIWEKDFNKNPNILKTIIKKYVKN